MEGNNQEEATKRKQLPATWFVCCCCTVTWSLSPLAFIHKMSSSVGTSVVQDSPSTPQTPATTTEVPIEETPIKKAKSIRTSAISFLADGWRLIDDVRLKKALPNAVLPRAAIEDDIGMHKQH